MELFLVCTESSGDLLGARLVHELKKRQPDLQVQGVGGEKLIAEGMLCLYQVSDFNVMGLFEVLSQLSRLRRQFNALIAAVLASNPGMVVLIDAPDFNLRFAKALRKQGFARPIIYYVSPQVWAWRSKRAKEIARLMDHMLVLFPFEKAIYEQLGLPTTWVGHPLVDEPLTTEDAQSFKLARGLDPSRPLVALAPGSRKSEVRRLLPTMVEVARARIDRYQFAIALAPTIDRQDVLAILGGTAIPILAGEMRGLTAHADVALVASGTATLETGLLQTPMIVGYRLQRLSYWLAKFLVKVDHFALVNIVLGDRIVPELLQDAFTPERILPLLDELADNGPSAVKIRTALQGLRTVLGGGGASGRAADVIHGFLTKQAALSGGSVS